MSAEGRTPSLGPILRTTGVAGQISYSVSVAYPDEPQRRVQFVGSIYGGPVLMITESDPGGTFVSSPDRFGDFGPEWVRRFFS